jgi:hypothetical protein
MHFLSYQIEEIINHAKVAFQKKITTDFSYKPSAEKWSKKEILGHLVDSAMNNTRRFTESQFSKTPYTILAYNQDELVKINKYQDKNIEELFNLWFILNKHIVYIIKDISEENLKIEINLYDVSIASLEFLIEDYIDHMKHHLKQIFE